MRFAVFITVVLGIWAAMHAYVFWRLSSLPWLETRFSTRGWLLLAIVLWCSYPLARILESRGWDLIALPLEFVSALWIGTLFLLLAGTLAADVLTLGGYLIPKHAALVRSGATILALVLSGIALIQGLRPPVVTEHEVILPGLPGERDGTRVVVLTDLHLGTLLGHQWLQKRLDQALRLRPDLLLLVGDTVDGNHQRLGPLVPVLKRLQAPLGVWAVTGNHEFYAGLEPSVALLKSAGIEVLRDEAREIAPGLVLTGVDDLTARQQYGLEGGLAKALANRKPGATLLMSHSPWQAAEAARLGVGLMLSGHTHNGQIWPFNYLVRLRYNLLTGRAQVDNMTVIVSRGTGTWGPRMRLWKRGEILLIRLRGL